MERCEGYGPVDKGRVTVVIDKQSSLDKCQELLKDG